MSRLHSTIRHMFVNIRVGSQPRSKVADTRRSLHFPPVSLKPLAFSLDFLFFLLGN